MLIVQLFVHISLHIKFCLWNLTTTTIVLLKLKKCVIACETTNNPVNWYLSASVDCGEQSQFMCSFIKMARDWSLDPQCWSSGRIERSYWQYWFPSRMGNGNFCRFVFCLWIFFRSGELGMICHSVLLIL